MIKICPLNRHIIIHFEVCMKMASHLPVQSDIASPFRQCAFCGCFRKSIISMAISMEELFTSRQTMLWRTQKWITSEGRMPSASQPQDAKISWVIQDISKKSHKEMSKISRIYTRSQNLSLTSCKALLPKVISKVMAKVCHRLTRTFSWMEFFFVYQMIFRSNTCFWQINRFKLPQKHVKFKFLIFCDKNVIHETRKNWVIFLVSLSFYQIVSYIWLEL